MTAITERRFYAEKNNRRLIAWQTRQLAMFISATIDTGENENTALAAAARLALDDDEIAELKEAQDQGVDVPEVTENAVGSYEKLMGGFVSQRG